MIGSVRLLFLCLARDCAETIPKFFAWLDELEPHGFQCRAIIGENGSQDRTRELIQAAGGSRIELLGTEFMSQEPRRLMRMAIGREALLQQSRKHQQHYDFVCVADLDNVMLAPPRPVALRDAAVRLEKDSTLFAIGATSRPVYYDLLALRAEGHDYASLNAEIASAQRKPWSYFRFHQRRIYSNQIAMTRPDPVPCLSSFNGFCMYNAKYYWLGTYLADNASEVAEHVSLNLSINRATGRTMLVSPDLYVATPQEHGPTDLLRFYARRMRKAVASFRMRNLRPAP